jgi:hypothetical protein
MLSYSLPSAVARMPCLVLCLLLGSPQRCWLWRTAGLLSCEEVCGQLSLCVAETGMWATVNCSVSWLVQVQDECC